jgi:hypothetical protein
MITVAVCSVNQQQFLEFKKNVEATIGCRHEIIKIDNAGKNESICIVYNQLSKMAAYDTICYCHEDIIIQTIDWGQEVLDILWDKEAAVGLVGAGGAVYKSGYPVAWTQVPVDYYRNNIIQQTKTTTEYNIRLDQGLYSQVEVIDGCFIAGKKQIFIDFGWNENEFRGFHLYDMDISLRVGQKYRVVVDNNLRLIHYSEGSFDKHWFKAAQKFCSIYKSKLPLQALIKTDKEKKELKYQSLIAYCGVVKHLGISAFEILKVLPRIYFLFPFRRQSWSILNMYIKYLVQ